jgi:CBS domain containing-hemolysin-like protein
LLEIGKYIGRLFLPRQATHRARLFAAREELKQVAVQSEREGSLTSTERAMIHNVVDFRNVSIRDVMVPLERSVTLKPEMTAQAALELSKSAGTDRFPVVSSKGQAVGLVNVLDILYDQTPATSLAKYTRRMVTAVENEPAYRIIRRLRAARLGSAAVLDARKKLLGFANEEDLIKRLVQSA